jgi:HK97 family phage portal protein
MDIFGLLTVTRKKAAPTQVQPLPSTSARGTSSWWPIIHEPYAGAWQKNEYVSAETALAYFAVFSCVTLIAADVSKLCLRLVQEDRNGIWTETDNPAYSPVIRKPNRYQTINKFVELWIVSKLTYGNAYVYKEYDARPVVKAMYVLDPSRVVPLVTPSGDLYYELYRDPLSGLTEERIIVPAADIIHDTMVPLFHPLLGVSPIFACGMAALQGLNIQANSKAFFANGANPSGMLTAPGSIDEATATRLKDQFSTKIGTLAVGGDGLKYEQFTMTAVDAQLIDQLKWTAENVCSCFHVPAYMIGIGPPPPYANIEPLLQQYYSQCIQSLLTNFETCLDEGLGIDGKVNGVQYGTEFDVDDLIWMDTATKTKAAGDGISSGGMSPNEARRKYYGLGPVKGGNTPYMQMQYYSLAALADRDADQPFTKPTPPDPTPTDGTADDALPADDAAATGKLVQQLVTAAAAVDWTADYA